MTHEVYRSISGNKYGFRILRGDQVIFMSQPRFATPEIARNKAEAHIYRATGKLASCQ